jgi:hypothetical protein
LTETRIGPDGKLQKVVNTITFDGKEHTWTDGTLATYVRPDDHHVHGTLKKNGHSQTVDAEISNDGKVLTLRVNGSGLNTGRAISNQIQVFDRE